jgi:hypothetical protein
VAGMLFFKLIFRNEKKKGILERFFGKLTNLTFLKLETLEKL